VKIKVGDTVEIIRGEDRGVRGTIRVVHPRQNEVIVEGVNIVIKHQRAVQAGRQQTQGGRIELEAPIDASNVMLVCPSCQEPTRVAHEVTDEGKVRVCKKCQEQID
jgi:large subunit ribosomal protein L24